MSIYCLIVNNIQTVLPLYVVIKIFNRTVKPQRTQPTAVFDLIKLKQSYCVRKYACKCCVHNTVTTAYRVSLSICIQLDTIVICTHSTKTSGIRKLTNWTELHLPRFNAHSCSTGLTCVTEVQFVTISSYSFYFVSTPLNELKY